MSRIYRVAVIGHTGRGDYGHGLDTVWSRVDHCQLVGVADPDPDGRARALERLGVERGHADYRAMLDDLSPDIVSIAPRWIDQHAEMVINAAERGIHIFMEKPFCRTLEEADRMIDACESHGVKLAIAHQTRYSPILWAIREAIDDGRIGDVLELRGRGKEDHRGGGEDLWVLGSHIMNLIHFFAGPPQWCFARVNREGQPIVRDDVYDGNEGIGPLAGDQVHAVYGMEHGVTAYFASRREARGGRFALQIFGSAGVIEVLTGYLPKASLLEDPSWSPSRSGMPWSPITSAGVNEPEPLPDGGLDAGNVAAVRDLLDAIEADRLPEANVYEARQTIEMIAAVFESHRQSRPVECPLVTRVNPLTLL